MAASTQNSHDFDRLPVASTSGVGVDAHKHERLQREVLLLRGELQRERAEKTRLASQVRSLQTQLSAAHKTNVDSYLFMQQTEQRENARLRNEIKAMRREKSLADQEQRRKGSDFADVVQERDAACRENEELWRENEELREVIAALQEDEAERYRLRSDSEAEYAMASCETTSQEETEDTPDTSINSVDGGEVDWRCDDSSDTIKLVVEDSFGGEDGSEGEDDETLEVPSDKLALDQDQRAQVVLGFDPAKSLEYLATMIKDLIQRNHLLQESHTDLLLEFASGA
ncbi:hypothetical protein MNV49_001730 [Pseudohyphozyma bogoriensis]|nr:hypothetical protein MNV49_001730 [Pseudohyphozyma bogoriensis]